MMKDIVVALLTTTIDRYSDLKCDRNWLPKEMVIKDLTGILDYIADLKEADKQPITVVLNDNTNIAGLEEYIKELEETCERNNEIIGQQWEKINKLKNDNRMWQNTCNSLREKLENMEGIK
ncbi:hypothetical protein [Clostridium sp. CTA-1]